MDRHLQELVTLKAIGEALNRAVSLEEAVGESLGLLLSTMGLKSGWCFLWHELQHKFEAVADRNIPPCLSKDEKRPLTQGICECQDLFFEGRLDRAANIVQCSRLENQPDAGGLQYHASVPLKGKDRVLGILNLAGPGQHLFSDEQLNFLSAAGHQVGIAMERASLYRAEQERAERFRLLSEVGQQIASMHDVEGRLPEVAAAIVRAFQFPRVTILVQEDERLRIAACHGRASGQLSNVIGQVIPVGETSIPGRVARSGRPHLPAALGLPEESGEGQRPEPDPGLPWRAYPAVVLPLRFGDSPLGLLMVEATYSRWLSPSDVDTIRQLAAALTNAMASHRLSRQKSDLSRLEERARLARDLHDSVTQSLFSMTLGAEAARQMLHTDPHATEQVLQELGQQAAAALKEMRALIFQLRTAGLGEGLTAALRRYAESHAGGLTVQFRVTGKESRLPRPAAEALLRIGQEALNNCVKHSGASVVTVALRVGEADARLTVTDDGRGFHPRHTPPGHFGLSTMRERAEALGGRLRIASRPGRGCRVTATVPLAGGVAK